MVKGSEKESNSPSSVNNNANDNSVQESTTSVNFQNKTVSDNHQLELLLLQQHQNQQQQQQQQQRQQIGKDHDVTPPISDGGGLIMNPNLEFLDNNHTSHGQVIDAEIRSHPAYIAYYYSNVNKNPTLPPPLLSFEEWQIFQRFQEVGDFVLEDGTTSSHPYNNQTHRGGIGMASQKAEDGLIEMRRTAARNLTRITSSDSLEGSSSGLCGQSNSGLGARRKSFADIQPGVIGKCSTPPSRLSRPASYNSLTDVINRASSTSELENKTKSFDALHSGHGSSTKLKSSELCRSLRPPPGFPTRTNFVSNDRSDEDFIVNSGSQSPSHKSPDNSEFSFSSYHEQQKLQQEFNKSGMNNFMSFKDYMNLLMENEVSHGTNFVHSNMERQMNFPQRASSMVNLQSLANASDYSRLPDTKLSHQSNNFPKRASSLVNLQSLANSSDSGTYTDFTDLGIKLSNAILEEENLKRNRVLGHSNHYSTNEQHQTQYLEKSDDCGRNTATMPRNLSHTRNAISTSYSANDLRELGKVYTEKFLTQEKQQDQQPFLYKPGHINRQYHGNPASSTFLCKGNQTAYSVRPAGPGRGRLQKEGGSRSFNASKNKEPVSPVSRNSQGKATVDGKVASGSLQEMKHCKNKSLELSDVLNDVVGFSKDQHGSRFLQQKLETATVEEKTSIFQKINPHARDLMTDVFGNYVIQKFFENGTEKQRKELANQVLGHVLPLSLQMYGCRVIQKALEVIDMEQKTQVARELDGSVMKCVHDQNGNHVIQKCIECVPQDRLRFIISSFFGQVVALSTHPYGCRVIQRVLEHCHDPHTQATVMDEILNSVCTLAQDQYGNYVIQYVLQHGKAHERSAIIAKLTGQIVTMSQQKFASNVVEKCLSFAAPEERKLIVKEMLGSTDDNEVLQAMMKDPFGNYVVQKVLETCDDQDRELILSRIRVHLNTLKKYTYGKHIVTRVEKLIEAGEKQTEMSKKEAS